MVKFHALINGKVVAEGDTMSQAIQNAEAKGYSREQVQVRSIRETPKV